VFLKVFISVLGIGLTAAALLALRQQRLWAVHESAAVQRRIAEHDRLLWKLRGDIAAQVTPDRVRELSARLGPMVHIGEPHINKPWPIGVAGDPAAATPAVPGRVPAPVR